MVTMVGSGLILGVALDAYRVLKERLHLRGWVVSLVDLLYWVAAASLVFHLLVWSNWGELRFYVFVAVLAGFWIYFSWFSDGVFRFLRWLLQGLERVWKGCHPGGDGSRLVSPRLSVGPFPQGGPARRRLRGAFRLIAAPFFPLVRFLSPLGKAPKALCRRLLRLIRGTKK